MDSDPESDIPKTIITKALVHVPSNNNACHPDKITPVRIKNTTNNHENLYLITVADTNTEKGIKTSVNLPKTLLKFSNESYSGNKDTLQTYTTNAFNESKSNQAIKKTKNNVRTGNDKSRLISKSTKISTTIDSSDTEDVNITKRTLRTRHAKQKAIKNISKDTITLSDVNSFFSRTTEEDKRINQSTAPKKRKEILTRNRDVHKLTSNDVKKFTNVNSSSSDEHLSKSKTTLQKLNVNIPNKSPSVKKVTQSRRKKSIPKNDSRCDTTLINAEKHANRRIALNRSKGKKRKSVYQPDTTGRMEYSQQKLMNSFFSKYKANVLNKTTTQLFEGRAYDDEEAVREQHNDGYESMTSDIELSIAKPKRIKQSKRIQVSKLETSSDSSSLPELYTEKEDNKKKYTVDESFLYEEDIEINQNVQNTIPKRKSLEIMETVSKKPKILENITTYSLDEPNMPILDEEEYENPTKEISTVENIELQELEELLEDTLSMQLSDDSKLDAHTDPGKLLDYNDIMSWIPKGHLNNSLATNDEVTNSVLNGNTPTLPLKTSDPKNIMLKHIQPKKI